jgi:hypothetical protein
MRTHSVSLRSDPELQSGKTSGKTRRAPDFGLWTLDSNPYNLPMSRARHIFFALLLALIFGVGVGLVLRRWSGGSTSKTWTTAALLQQVKTVSELVTVQYVIEKVVVVEDVKWIAVLGESRVLMVAHGIVKAGIDLSQLQGGDLQLAGKRISIKLPHPRITDAYLDDNQTRVVERSTGLLREFDKDLEQTARQNAIDDIRRAARTSGILKDADVRARAQLKQLFEALGFEVEFRAP